MSGAPRDSSPSPGPWTPRQGPRGIDLIDANGEFVMTVVGNLAREAENPNLRLVLDAPGLLAERRQALDGTARADVALGIYVQGQGFVRSARDNMLSAAPDSEDVREAFRRADVWLAGSSVDANESASRAAAARRPPDATIAEDVGVGDRARAVLKGPHGCNCTERGLRREDGSHDVTCPARGSSPETD